VTPAVTKLPPNPIRHFYRGGPAIAELRGFELDSDHAPEEWIGSAATLFGETERGLSRLPDGTRVRDALASDPEAWLGAAHAGRFGADPALLVKLLDAGERLPVHAHPDAAYAGAHLGSRFGKTEAWIVVGGSGVVAAGWREDVAPAKLARWVADQDVAAMLAALHEVEVRAGDALFVPAGVPHAIGAGLLIAELQEPSDMSVLLEWEQQGVAEHDATLGLGWELALRAVGTAAADPAAWLVRGAAHGAAADAPASERANLLPAAADGFFRAERLRTGRGTTATKTRADTTIAGFAVLVVLDGSGTLSGPTTDATTDAFPLGRGDTVVVPHAAGPLRLDGTVDLLVCRPPNPAAVTNVNDGRLT
jgi:mannose-6-phosphate isomerase